MLATVLRKTQDQDSEVVGVRIIAQDERDQKILRRFWDGGMKMNSMYSESEIGITFEDLIK